MEKLKRENTRSNVTSIFFYIHLPHERQEDIPLHTYFIKANILRKRLLDLKSKMLYHITSFVHTTQARRRFTKQIYYYNQFVNVGVAFDIMSDCF